MPVHENSLRNLIPAQPGDIRNPAGRPKNAGRTFIEHLNDCGQMTSSELRDVWKDKSLPMLRRRAAQKILSKRDVWSICDYTGNKPADNGNININHVFGTAADRSSEAATASERLRAILKPSAN